MFVGTTGSLKNPKRDALCNAFEIGYCQFFNLKKIIPWNKRHPKPVFYQQAKVKKKKRKEKKYPESFPRSANDISKQQSHGRAPVELQIYLVPFFF